MGQWKDDSNFLSYITQHPAFFSPTPAHPSSMSFDDESLYLATNAIHRLSSRLPETHPLSRRLKEILDFTQEIQTCSATMRTEQLFEKLQPLRAWLFWMPVTLIQADEIDNSEMILLAQLYTIALAIDSSIPELGGAALGSLTVDAIQKIDDKLRHCQSIGYGYSPESADLDEMMQFSRLMLTRYRLEGPESHELSQQIHGPQSPYGFQHLSIGSLPSTPGFAPGTPAGYPQSISGYPGHYSMLPSHSFEDLSVPASPFLRYGSPASRPHSQILEASPRLSDVSFEKRPSSLHSFRGDSPAYSPGYIDDEPVFTFGGHSPSYTGGFVAPTTWT